VSCSRFRTKWFRSWPRCAVLFAALPWSGWGAPSGSNLQLQADTRFPIAGGAITLHLSGPANADYVLKASGKAKQTELPGIGTVYLDLLQSISLASGFLDAAGLADVLVPVPADPKFLGGVYYFQFGAGAGGVVSVSNALSVRIQSAPPSGARQPEAIAVTPDGSRVYVLHEEDATVSVIDPTTDTLLADMPIGRIPTSIGLPCRAAVDPEGRHAFFLHPALPKMTVIDTATDSISAQVPVPLACGGIAFDFSGPDDLIYVTSEREAGVIVFTEAPAGTFTRTALLPIQGQRPGPIVVLPGGDLMVGDQESHELEVIDPTGAPIARTPLGSLPMSLVLSGSSVFLPTFLEGTGADDGLWAVLEVELSGYTVVDELFEDLGTDYLDAEASGSFLVFPGAGSGTVLVADATTLVELEVVDLNPGGPPGTPHDVAFVPPPGGGEPRTLYAIDHFRETVRPIDLTSGPPFSLRAEIALAHSGQPREQLLDLPEIERGEWLFQSVAYFNGTATDRNPVSCSTCHPQAFSYGVNRETRRQPPALFRVSGTGPFLWSGAVASMASLAQSQFTVHGKVGGTLDPQFLADLVAYESSIGAPESPYLGADGSLAPAAQAGRLVFEGAAQCSSCHAEPFFIPVAPDPLTIAAGVGTGFAPINVPSLLGVWSTAPYLHDGSATTLRDVLTSNAGDLHGVTSTLTEQELSDLVEYLKSL